MDIVERICELQKQKNAVILAHYYQQPEVQDVADFVGDSFELSRRAREVEQEVIVFCGVHFMAESAKILNPEKTVLLPAKDAGCPMADMVTEEDVLNLRSQYPDAAVVCYVNSSAEVKAVSDVCCTSSNAVKIVKALENKRIIFVPDSHLGHYVSLQVPEKEIILFDGYCITHKRVQVEDVHAVRNAMPNVDLLVHPECSPEIVRMADFVGSTAQIINYATKSESKRFIIGTEQGILHPLKTKNPEKEFYMLTSKLICGNMKKTKITDVLNALENMTFEITLEEEKRRDALASLDKMLEMA